MARAASNQNYFAFVKGLITEANPLTYPEGASLDEDNMDLKANGSRVRRTAIDYELGAVTTVTVGATDANMQTWASDAFLWRGVAGSASLNHVIKQTGRYLTVHNVDVNVVSVAAIHTVDLNLFKADVALAADRVGDTPVDITYGNGVAYVVSPVIEPFYIELHADLATYTNHQITQSIRDFEGLDDGLAVDTRPPAADLTALQAAPLADHYYNLINQGWNDTHLATYIAGGTGTWVGVTAITLAVGATTQIEVPNNLALVNGKSVDINGVIIPGGDPNINGTHVISNVTAGATTTFTIPIDTSTAVGPYTGGSYRLATTAGVAPSNSDIWTYGKDASDVFAPTLMDKQWFGTTHAPKGRYIYNPYNMDRSTNSVNLVPATHDYVTLARPSTCAYYAGRLWTSGIATSKLAGTIFFSKVITNVALDAGKARQEADPTSEIISALQPDDGGVINIPETGAIHKLVPVANGIAIVAQNGVWLVRGGSDTGFTADIFSVVKVTSVGCDAPKSVVTVEGSLLYMSRSGIYLISPDQSGLSLQAQNITQNTIQSEFNSIPYTKLQLCKAVFDPVEREVKFYYTTDTASLYTYRYDRVLTLDMRLQAFYKSSISGTSGVHPHVSAVFPSLNVHATGVYESGIRHFCAIPNVGNWDYSVAVMYNNNFMDWFTFDSIGVSFDSYVETGYELFDDAMRNKTIDHIFIFMERTELTATDGTENNQSSCLMQVKFDWTDNTNSQKWTDPLEVYVYTKPFLLNFSPANPGTENLDYGYSVITKKEKVRGTGKALRLRFESTPGKDMRILGWAISTSGETAV